MTVDPQKLRRDIENIPLPDEEIVEILRRQTPAERVAMIGLCNRRVRQALREQTCKLHPAWNEEQIQAEIKRRRIRISNEEEPAPPEGILTVEVLRQVESGEIPLFP